MRIEGADRIGIEPLLRYCAGPPFALEYLHQRDALHLVYRNPNPVRGSAPGTRPAVLLARIYEALPLSCPICHGQIRIVAFVNDADTVRKILDHIGESTSRHTCSRA